METPYTQPKERFHQLIEEAIKEYECLRSSLLPGAIFEHNRAATGDWCGGLNTLPVKESQPSSESDCLLLAASHPCPSLPGVLSSDSSYAGLNDGVAAIAKPPAPDARKKTCFDVQSTPSPPPPPRPLPPHLEGIESSWTMQGEPRTLQVQPSLENEYFPLVATTARPGPALRLNTSVSLQDGPAAFSQSTASECGNTPCCGIQTSKSIETSAALSRRGGESLGSSIEDYAHTGRSKQISKKKAEDVLLTVPDDIRRRRRGKRSIFFDRDAMKFKVLEEVLKHGYDVSSLYHEHGFCQAVLRHRRFDAVSQVIILANALWLGVEVDQNHADMLLNAPLEFQVIEHLFAVYFFAEWLLRLCAFRSKSKGLTDVWFALDSLLVFLMVLDNLAISLVVVAMLRSAGDSSTSELAESSVVFQTLRMMRLLRIARVGKLIRAMPELFVMLRAMATALRTVLVALTFLLAIDYTFAVAFTQMARGSPLEIQHFPSVLESMHTLLISGAFPDMEEIMRDTMEHHLFFWVVLFVYLLLASVTIMNMMLGVLVDVVKSASQVEQESLGAKALRDSLISEIQRIDNIEVLDPTCINVTKEHFFLLLERREVLMSLHSCSVDICGLIDLIDFLFMDDKQLTLYDLIRTILQFRSCSAATVKDVVELRKYLTHELELLKASLR